MLGQQRIGRNTSSALHTAPRCKGLAVCNRLLAYLKPPPRSEYDSVLVFSVLCMTSRGCIRCINMEVRACHDTECQQEYDVRGMGIHTGTDDKALQTRKPKTPPVKHPLRHTKIFANANATRVRVAKHAHASNTTRRQNTPCPRHHHTGNTQGVLRVFGDRTHRILSKNACVLFSPLIPAPPPPPPPL